MKIRNGFVSNSSSSSFLIYGYAIDNDKTKDIIEECIKSDFEGMQKFFKEDFCYDNIVTEDDAIAAIDKLGVGQIACEMGDEKIFPFRVFLGEDEWDTVVFVGKTLDGGDTELYISYATLPDEVKKIDDSINTCLSRMNLTKEEVGLNNPGLHVYSYYDG